MTNQSVFKIRPTTVANLSTKQDKPKSKCWVNIGYKVGEGDSERFVNLGRGIALDDMEHFATNSSNQEFAQFRAAQNGLLDQLRTYILNELKPGESSIIDTLVIEVRHAKDDQEVPAGDNPYLKAVV